MFLGCLGFSRVGVGEEEEKRRREGLTKTTMYFLGYDTPYLYHTGSGSQDRIKTQNYLLKRQKFGKINRRQRELRRQKSTKRYTVKDNLDYYYCCVQPRIRSLFGLPSKTLRGIVTRNVVMIWSIAQYLHSSNTHCRQS